MVALKGHKRSANAVLIFFSVVSSTNSFFTIKCSFSHLRIPDSYSLHRKKVYTCGKAKYSKPGGVFHLALSILSTQLDKSVYFLLGETV